MTRRLPPEVLYRAMNIYLAGSFGERFRLREIRDELARRGYSVQARWLDIPETVDVMGTDQGHRISEAARDIQDIGRCDRLIVDTTVKTSTGGSDVELGYAFGRMKSVWVVGPVRHVFHELAQQRFDTWEEALTHLPGTDHAR